MLTLEEKTAVLDNYVKQYENVDREFKRIFSEVHKDFESMERDKTVPVQTIVSKLFEEKMRTDEKFVAASKELRKAEAEIRANM